MYMSKTQFRLLVIASFAFSIFGSMADLIFSDPLVKQISEYAESLEPEWSDTRIYVSIGYVLICIFYMLYTFLGLLLFWNSARHVYLAGLIILTPLCPALGIGVMITSGISQALYDIGSILTGVVLALIYFTPIKKHFTAT